MSYLYNLIYKNLIYHDIQIIINNQVFKLHKPIISQKSIFFKCLIENENNMDITTPIEIYGASEKLISSDKIDDILGWLYSDQMSNIPIIGNKLRCINISLNFNDLLDYYYISDYLQIEILKNRCIEVINLYLELCHKHYIGKKTPREDYMVFNDSIITSNGNNDYIERRIDLLFNKNKHITITYHKIILEFFEILTDKELSDDFKLIFKEYFETEDIKKLIKSINNLSKINHDGSLNKYISSLNYNKNIFDVINYYPPHFRDLLFSDMLNIFDIVKKEYKYVLIKMLHVNNFLDDKKSLLNDKTKEIEVFSEKNSFLKEFEETMSLLYKFNYLMH